MSRNNGNGNGTPNHGIGNGKGQGYDNGEGHEKQEEKELNKPEAYEYIRYLNDISVAYPQVLMTADSKGTYRGVYTYGLERISVRDEVSVEGKPNNPLYYLYDGRGSVSQLTNTNGNVRDQYRYEPFGAPMPGGGLEPDTRLLNNPYGYNGEDYDIESDLQYLRARYYDPEIGRFISEDSYLGEIMQPLTLNRYAYTANNPLMYQDPSGHSVVKLGSRGQSVKELQQLLISSGYNGLKVDGIFGKDTLSAVIAYQTSKGLAVDGIVGSQTWGALRGSTSTNPTLRKGSRGGAVTKLQQGLMRLDYLGPYGADGVFGNQTWAALAQKKVISNNRNDCGGGNKKKGNAKTLLTVLEKDKTKLFGREKKYYVQSDRGNVTINGVKYFEANSKETVSLYKVYNIDYGFQTKGYVEGVKNALPDADLNYPDKLKYVYTESHTNGKLDQKQYLDQGTLYLFDGKLYNKNEAGNVIWGGAMRQMGFWKSTTITIAQGGTLATERRFDESWDQDALKSGYDYQDRVLKKHVK